MTAVPGSIETSSNPISLATGPCGTSPRIIARARSIILVIVFFSSKRKSPKRQAPGQQALLQKWIAGLIHTRLQDFVGRSKLGVSVRSPCLGGECLLKQFHHRDKK